MVCELIAGVLSVDELATGLDVRVGSELAVEVGPDNVGCKLVVGPDACVVGELVGPVSSGAVDEPVAVLAELRVVCEIVV